MLNPISIQAPNLSMAWFQTVYKCVEVCHDYTIDRGSFEGQKRLEFDHFTCHITHPGTMPLLPHLNPGLGIPDPVPGGMDYVNDYLSYLMTGEEKEGEAYTYGQRMDAVPVTDVLGKRQTAFGREIYIQDSDVWGEAFNVYKKGPLYRGEGVTLLSQIELMIWTYKEHGYRNNQMILQVGQPDDMLLKDPPCLRHIDTRIQDGALHFFPYFRSWDLFGGFPANLAAIEFLKQYCAAQLGVKNGEMIVSSKGLHLYSYVWEMAELIRGKSIEEFREDLAYGHTIFENHVPGY